MWAGQGPGVAMQEQPATLATPAAIGPGADAGGAAAAAFRLCRGFLDLAAGVSGLAQAGEPPPGLKAVELAAAGAAVVAAAPTRLLTRGTTARPAAAFTGVSHRAARPRRSGRGALAVGPPKAACYILQGSR
jgi:hypothetical protein